MPRSERGSPPSGPRADDGPIAFWLLGMAIPLATAALAWVFLLRRFFVGDDRKAGSR
jgi:hypothetical protein